MGQSVYELMQSRYKGLREAEPQRPPGPQSPGPRPRRHACYAPSAYELYMTRLGDEAVGRDNDYEINYIPPDAYVQYAFYRRLQISDTVGRRFREFEQNNAIERGSRVAAPHVSLPEVDRQRLRALQARRAPASVSRLAGPGGRARVCHSYPAPGGCAAEVLREE